MQERRNRNAEQQVTGTGKLVFDVGMHLGQDAEFYLKEGHQVVAIDADPGIVAQNCNSFAREIASGQLRIVNCAVADRDGTMPFFLSENSVWNSLKKGISDREGSFKEEISVETRTLASLLAEFGTPLFMKIDIEGYDAVALRSLAGAEEKPTYISVETECLEEGEVPDEEQPLETLHLLRDLGYSGFKLIDQRTLEGLTPGRSPYAMSSLERLRRRLSKKFGRRRIDRLRRDYGCPFPMGASGPFGEDADGEWVDFEVARELLVSQRRRFFEQTGVANYLFWCDWHARDQV